MPTETEQTATSQRPNPTVWVALLLLAAAGWTVVLLQVRGMGQMDQGMAELSPQPASLLLFLPVWVSMMAAMMFPVVAPVVSLFAAISRRRQAAGEQAASPVTFLAGYLAVWTLFGVAAYLLSLAAPAIGMAAPGLRAYSPVAAGLLLILAGVYQWSPLKQVCLRHCRSPLSVIMHGWREGAGGAFRMGAGHGVYCLGCCWGLMAVLFAVGLMNLLAMLLLTAIIFAEKVVPRGPVIGKAAAVGLVLFGALTLTMRLPG